MIAVAGRRAVVLMLVVLGAGCEGNPEARTSQPHAADTVAGVADALAEIAWPRSPMPAVAGARPRIRMASLPRPRVWPNLQRWRAGGDVSREPTVSLGMSPREREILGEQVFATYCVRCHGPEGRGDGPLARRLYPPPRNLVRGPFRFRSTPTGAPPTELDLFRTVSGGLHGTAMMAFADLPEEQRWAVVSYVRSLAVRSQPAVTPVTISPHAGTRIEAGRALTEQLGCASCHGGDFRGSAPSTSDLRDVDGRPIGVRDLRRRPPKRGRDPASLYLTLATGLDGTPMPSYLEVTTADERWAVVDYMLSIIPAGP